jgi:hypothetical protein
LFSGFGLVSSDFFGILMLIERSELDEGACGECTIPMIEANEQLMGIEKKIMVRLL